MSFNTESRNMKMRTLGVVLEDNPGVDPGTGYTVLFANTASTKSDGDKIENKYISPVASPQGSEIIGKKTTHSIELDYFPGGLQQDGTPIPPLNDPLMQACGLKKMDAFVITGTITGTFEMGEVVNLSSTEVGTVQYVDGTTAVWLYKTGSTVPVATDELEGVDSGATIVVTAVLKCLAWRPVTDTREHKSLTIHDIIDGIRDVSTYCRGNMKISFKVKDKMKMNFDFTGIYHEPDTSTLLDTEGTSTRALKCNPAVLTISNLDVAQHCTVESFDIDLTNEVGPDDDIQEGDAIKSVTISNRVPKGNVDPSVVQLSTWNPFPKWSGSIAIPVGISVGEEPGKRFRIIVNEGQLDGVDKTGERKGKMVYKLSYMCLGKVKKYFDNEVSFWQY